VTALGTAVRWAHLATTVLVAGAFVALLLAGRSRWPTGQAWEARVLAWARGLLLVALATGLAAIGHQAALVENRWAAAGETTAILRLLLETHGGQVWLARLGLLLVLAVFAWMRPDATRRPDWLAARGQAALLALAALGLGAAGGHAAAVEDRPVLALTADAAHLLAAAAWVGALPAVAMLLAAAARPEGADSRPYAVVATRRFSRLALAAVLALTASGTVNTALHVGTIAGLVGTRYGGLLLAKLAVMVALLAVAAANRRALPALGGDGDAVGRPAMRRLARFVGVEAALAGVVLGIVAALGVTAPARHEQPWWPFSYRLTLDVLAAAPDLERQSLVGSQIAVAGLVGLVAATVAGVRRLFVIPPALALLAGGLAVAVPPLAVDAYPTTYFRPTVPYHATSIAQGQRIYRERCAACHGPSGAGDGPAGRGLPRPPADLRAPHTGQHTAGDLFWWLTHGIPRGGMPAFGRDLTEEERWDAINFVRTLAAGQQARFMGTSVGPPALVAPDFNFAVGPTAPRTLRDYRGRRVVLLVLYTLPGSRERLEQLAQRQDLLTLLGVEVIAVPRDARPDAIRRLGADARIMYHVVTEGAPDILAAYDLLASTPHAEFLVDRQGYLRARWAPAGRPERDVTALLDDAQKLNAEPASAPAADEHVH
jgi:putative copper resistance protein D